MIELGVVHHIDKELGRGAVDGISPSHGDGAPLVGKPIVSFIFDGGVGGLLINHALPVPAGLDYGVGDDAVKNDAVIKVKIEDISQLDKFLTDKLRVLPDVFLTTTMIITEQFKP